jgi:hypothetical protein
MAESYSPTGALSSTGKSYFKTVSLLTASWNAPLILNVGDNIATTITFNNLSKIKLTCTLILDEEDEAYVNMTAVTPVFTMAASSTKSVYININATSTSDYYALTNEVEYNCVNSTTSDSWEGSLTK